MTTVESGGVEKSLRVMLLGFNPVVREGLQAILAKDQTISLVGEALDENQALQYIKSARDRGKPVSVVLTETRNGSINGVQITRIIKDKFPEVAVLVLTENLNDSFVIDAIHAGAGGYIFLKDMTPDSLLKSIHRVIEGDAQLSTVLLRAAVENLLQNGRKTLAERTAEAANLTAREVDVLRLMGNGDSNKEISSSLNITLDTVKKHIRNVIDKLQARSRTHASIIAAQAGITGTPLTSILEKEKATSPD